MAFISQYYTILVSILAILIGWKYGRKKQTEVNKKTHDAIMQYLSEAEELKTPTTNVNVSKLADRIMFLVGSVLGSSRQG
jgi:hypothetical protein